MTAAKLPRLVNVNRPRQPAWAILADYDAVSVDDAGVLTLSHVSSLNRCSLPCKSSQPELCVRC